MNYSQKVKNNYIMGARSIEKKMTNTDYLGLGGQKLEKYEEL
jgi:hypothetical protein